MTDPIGTEHLRLPLGRKQFMALAIFSPFAWAIAVDPITGHFTADALIQIADSTTAQRLGLTTFPGTVPPLSPNTK